MIAGRTLVRSRLLDIPDLDIGPLHPRQRALLSPWSIVAVLIAVIGVAARSPLLFSVGPPGVWAAKQMRSRRHRRRERQRVDRSVIDLADHIGQHLRGGNSLASSIETALSGVGAELDARVLPIQRARRAGDGLASALRRADVDGSVALELLLSSLRLLVDNGGPAAISIDRVGDTLRAVASASEEAAAQAGQATASAAMLACLPLVFATIVAAAEPAVAAFYVETWTGAACVAGAGVLSSLSWWWIDRAVHR